MIPYSRVSRRAPSFMTGIESFLISAINVCSTTNQRGQPGEGTPHQHMTIYGFDSLPCDNDTRDMLVFEQDQLMFSF